MKYSRQEIINKCEKAFENIPQFYQKDFINYRGRTSDSDEYYSEVVAEFVVERIEQYIKGIPMISRTQGYNANHDGRFTDGSGRTEEITAIKMFNECKQGCRFDYVGTMIDYQIPLKATQSDKAGKIDLLSYDGRIARILELKKQDSNETMLRCVLEGFTYLKTVNVPVLLKDFNLPENTEVKASPYVFKGGTQWQEWVENRPALTKLMNLLECKPYFITNDKGAYLITEE